LDGVVNVLKGGKEVLEEHAVEGRVHDLDAFSQIGDIFQHFGLVFVASTGVLQEASSTLWDVIHLARGGSQQRLGGGEQASQRGGSEKAFFEFLFVLDKTTVCL
jgi:hypothetical protein